MSNRDRKRRDGKKKQQGRKAQPDPLYRQVFKLCERYAAAKLWAELDDEQAFFVKIPGQQPPMVASILGSMGEEFGLALFHGERALESFLSILECSENERDALHDFSQINLGLYRLHEIPVEHRGWLERAGCQALRDAIVPFVSGIEPRQHPREANRDETQMLGYALAGILRAWEQRLLVPTPVARGDDILCLVVEGELPEVTVRTEWQSATPAITLPEGVIGAPPELDTLPRGEWRLVVGTATPELRIENQSDQLLALIAADAESGKILASEVFIPTSASANADVFFRLLTTASSGQPPSLPGTIVFTNRALKEACTPALAALGVAIEHDPGNPVIWRARASLETFVEAVADELEYPDLPAANDWKGWRAADDRLTARQAKFIARTSPFMPGLIEEYFAWETDAEDALLTEVPEELTKTFGYAPLLSLADWIFYENGLGLDEGPTLADEMSQMPLPPAEAALLDSARATDIGAYRVESVKPGESVSVIDLDSGARCDVHDVEISKCVTPNVILFLHLRRAGDFTFASCAGPAMEASQFQRAMRTLRRMDYEPSMSWRSQATFLGFLWIWLMEECSEGTAGLDSITSLTGEQLRLQSTAFRVGDLQALRAALAARDDIDLGDGDTWTWLSEEGSPGLPGLGRIVRGRLTLIGQELVLDTNAAEQTAAAIEWLERIPGVLHLSTTERPLTSLARDDTLSPPVPVKPSAERTAQLVDSIRTFYMQWLDRPLPMLDGRTPREAVERPGGREHVRRIILGIPEPMIAPGVVQVAVPRDEMLRELGLS